jgi:hypothetical protein
MALTAEEKSKVMRHLGFAEVTEYTSAAGPIVQQLGLRVNAEHQIEKLTSYGETRVRSILTTLDAIESRMAKATKRLAATQVGEIGIRGDELPRLEDEYRRWGARLSETIGAMPNSFSERYGSIGLMGRRG